MKNLSKTIGVFYIIAIVIITVISAFRAYMAFQSYRGVEKLLVIEQEFIMGSAATEQAKSFTDSLETVYNDLEVLSVSERIIGVYDICPKLLFDSRNASRTLAEYYYRVAPDGTIVCSSHEDAVGSKVPAKAGIADITANPDRTSEFVVYTDPESKTASIYIHLPVYDQGSYAGTLTAKIDNSLLLDTISQVEDLNLNEIKSAFTLTPEGEIFAHTNKAYVSGSIYQSSLELDTDFYQSILAAFVAGENTVIRNDATNEMVALQKTEAVEGDEFYYVLLADIDNVDPLLSETVAANKQSGLINIFANTFIYVLELVAITLVFRQLLKRERVNQSRSQEQKQEVESSKQVLMDIISRLPLGVFLVSTEAGEMQGRIIRVNQPGATFISSVTSKPTGKLMRELIQDEDLRNMLKEMEEGKEFGTYLWKYKKKDSTLYIDVTMMKTGNDSFAVIVSDETSEREQEEDYRKLQKLRSNFINIIAHQLRTPLNSISWLLEATEEGGKHVIDESVIETIVSAVRFMETVFNDFMLFLEISEGRVNLSTEEVDLNTLLAQVKVMLDKKYGEEGYEVNLDVAEHVILDCDSAKIRRVLEHVVENAYLYGKKKINIRLIDSEGYVKILVEDSGIGIPDDAKPHVYEPFFRASNAMLIDPDRTGLGLALSKGILEAHGGSIEIKSSEEKGTEVLIVLPKKSIEEMMRS